MTNLRMMEAMLLLLLSISNFVQASTLLEAQLKEIKYEKYQKPRSAVNITVQVYVHSLGKIDESDFTFEVGFYLRQWWNDPRLASKKFHTIRTTSLDKLIWTPNTSVLDSHQTKEFKNAIRTVIEPNGEVYVARRLLAKSRCEMNLKYYPMDLQVCHLTLENYAYATDEINISWHHLPISRRQGILLDGYDLIGINTETETYQTVIGHETESFKLLHMHFYVKRTFMYFVYRAYIPSVLLSVFSFASFWIPDTAVPARIGIIVTGFLANVFILQGVSEQTVKVSYTTPMQIFLVVNISLIICALIEYVIILQLQRRKKDKVDTSKDPSDLNTHVSYGSFLMLEQKRKKKTNGFLRQNAVFKNDYAPAESDYLPLHDDVTSKQTKTKQPTRPDVHKLDRVTQILLPILYLIFLTCYFGYYRNVERENVNMVAFKS
ncbi:gamma-aminobutyric acid receptor subunit alpha-2-like isoform X2 [Hydractinia symbiolongicarpus]|uniref:gamma-aminobutyric acid receptor subunit alpha-2-like isoform X2 n=1 Tax=Hydractinia symbiolongicarpus TaxID=13093 RepID=UPI0025510662|nr:gamma-aminobutyric acid receptor subunit alpha-2-like isoform X2 [Hydractinia symbiolongicarpus]